MMTTRKASRLMGAFAALLLGLAGAAAAAEDDLRIGNLLDVTSWDPALADIGFDGPYLSAVYDPLVIIDETGKVLPALATDWQFSEDRLTLTMNLRQGVRFSDGTPFNADAAVANLEHLKAGARSSEAYHNVKSVRKVDDDTVEIALSARDDSMLYLMGLGRSYMISPDVIAKGTAAAAPVGSGPYTLEKAVPGAEYDFTRVPGHWDAATYPYDKVAVFPILDPTARHNAMLSGQVNVSYGDPVNNQQAEAAGWNVSQSPAGWVGLMFLDHEGKRLPPLKDVRVRQALNHAFNGPAILKAVSHEAGKPANQVFAVGRPGHVAALDNRYPYDFEKAKALMADAGFADGFDVTMPMAPLFQPWQPVTEQTLGLLNIRVQWDNMQTPDYQVNAPKYPMFIAFIAMDGDPIANLARQVTMPQWYNLEPEYAKFPEIAALVEKAQTLTGDDQIKAVEALNTKLTEEAWWSVWYQAANVYHAQPGIRVTGVPGMMFPTLRFIKRG